MAHACEKQGLLTIKLCQAFRTTAFLLVRHRIADAGGNLIHKEIQKSAEVGIKLPMGTQTSYQYSSGL